jgi:tetratricopeptide (TPR) repeat protein
MIPLYTDLGNNYMRIERYKPAEIVFKNALKIDPNFINAHYGLVGAYLNQNKIEEALVELQKVTELAPDSQMAKSARELIQQITQEKLKSSPPVFSQLAVHTYPLSFYILHFVFSSSHFPPALYLYAITIR